MDDKYFVSGWEVVAIDAAMSPMTHQDILRELSEKHSDYLRSIVARNPNTPKDALEKLSRDRVYSVRHSVAANPSISLDIFRVLVNDHSDAHASHLACIACRLAVCGKYKIITKELIEELSNHHDRMIRQIIASQEDVDLNILIKFSGDKDRSVRLAVASNPSAPHVAIKNLMEDEIEDIAKIAANHPCLKHLITFK